LKTKDRIQYSSLKLWFTDTPWLLLIGLQGTGKSLTAKAIASDWQLPLLKLDVGKLFGGIGRIRITPSSND
jgi:SpoVK/Ycf46/Vps4 family AAA+-type ATPase